MAENSRKKGVPACGTRVSRKGHILMEIVRPNGDTGDGMLIHFRKPNPGDPAPTPSGRFPGGSVSCGNDRIMASICVERERAVCYLMRPDILAAPRINSGTELLRKKIHNHRSCKFAGRIPATGGEN